MQDHGSVSNKGPVHDRAALQMHDMSNDTIISDHCVVLGSGVEDSIVLDARALTDTDLTVVTAQDRSRPNRRIGADLNRSNDDRIGMNVCGWMYRRGLIAKGIDGHPLTVPVVEAFALALGRDNPPGCPIPLRTMSRRIEIELTSALGDGTWTWRAAGAKNPRGVVDSSILPADAKVAQVLKVEVEQAIDGITVLSVVGGRARAENAERLELLGGGEFQPVIETRTGKRERRDGDRRDGGRRRNRDDRRGTEGEDRPRSGDRRRKAEGDDRPRSRGPRFTPPPEMPQRPKPKRLRAQKTHRTAVLAGIPAEQRPIAELALQGISAVRTRLRAENDKATAEGRATMPEASVIKMAEELLPRLRVAEWLDRAEAAIAQSSELDLRDLRSVVAAGDDPIVARDEGTRAIADQLKVALRSRQDQELQLWFGDVDAALALGRVIRALRLSSQPPKAGVPFPADIAQRLVDSTNATLTPAETQERWIAVLEAAAFSPIRSQIKPMGMPATIGDELKATVVRLAPALPQIASLFGIEVQPGAPMPRPLRTTPNRAKPDRSSKAKPSQNRSGAANQSADGSSDGSEASRSLPETEASAPEPETTPTVEESPVDKVAPDEQLTAEPEGPAEQSDESTD